MNARPVRYTIRVEGHLGATAVCVFPALAVEYHATQTVLTGLLDRSAVYGVLAQFEMLGLDLVELRRSPDPHPAVDDEIDAGHV
jgi:hypothetical protein